MLAFHAKVLTSLEVLTRAQCRYFVYSDNLGFTTYSRERMRDFLFVFPLTECHKKKFHSSSRLP